MPSAGQALLDMRTWVALAFAFSACRAPVAVDGVTDAWQGADTVLADQTGVADAAAETETSVLPDVASDTFAADVAACVASVERCDGVDNNCDGTTDEGFFAQSPQGPVPLGTPCGKGKVVCISPTQADCSVPTTDGGSQVDLSAVLALPGASVSPLQAKGGFVDVSKQLPIAALPLHAGSKTAVPDGSTPLALDVDGDGDLDLIWLDDVDGIWLWTQTKPWQFTPSSLQSGVGGLPALAALQDGPAAQLLVGGSGVLLLERNPAGKFVDVAAARGIVVLPGTQTIRHLLPADVNDDGVLDIVAGVFSCSPLYPAAYVWLGRGDGQYEEASKVLGFNLTASVWSHFNTDYDGDGLGDFIALTESCEPAPGVGFFRHQAFSTSGAPFTLTQVPPVFTAPGSPSGSPMGGSAADVNGDGVLDYLLAEIELRDYVDKGGDAKNLNPSDPKLTSALSNQFLLSQPGGGRKLAGLQAGLWAPLGTSGLPMIAWTAVWSDLDHDGHLDLVLSHASDLFGWTSGAAGSMRPVFFRNDGTQHFTDVSAAFNLPPQHDGRTLLAVDLDGDGDDDLVLGGQGVAPRVLRNDIVHGGTDLRVRLRGHASNPWGLLARLSLKTNFRTLAMEHSVQAVPQSMALPESHFSLQAGEKPQSLQVLWPSGWTSQIAVTQPGFLQVDEPELFSLSARWSKDGKVPVTVQARQFAANGQLLSPAQCSIELAPGAKGQWQGPVTCQGSVCTRTWIGTAATQGGADTLSLGCGGQTWKVRPRISY